MTTHIVQAGETLGRIAKQHGTDVAAILEVNQQIRNPNLIHVGDKVNIPGPSRRAEKAGKAKGRTHTVKRGETLGKIAARFGTTVDKLMAANPGIKDRNVIAVGQLIAIPSEKSGTKGRSPAAETTKPKVTVQATATKKHAKSSTTATAVELYIVRQGDTLGKIGAAFGVSVDALMLANPLIKNRDRIRPGQAITIPGKRSVLDVTRPETHSGEPAWMAFAMRELGTREVAGPQHNRRILEYHATAGGHSSDEVPWCSSFVNWCIIQSGLKGTNNAMARSWLSWGRTLSTPKVGCITVLRRGTGTVKGHVGFFLKSSGNTIELLGGNQSNSVSKKTYKAADLLGFRWPKDA